MELKTFIARVAGGQIVPSAAYYVYLADTLTLAAIYDKDGIAMPNPGAASASGQIAFAATDGDYDLRVTDGATLDNVMRVRFSDSVTELRADLANDTDPAKGASLVGYNGQTVSEFLDDNFIAEKFGLVGDDSTDNTAAFTAIFADTAVTDIYLPDGIYRHGNLTLPNRRLTIHGSGNLRCSLKCVSPANPNYGIASEAYVNNLTTGNEPIEFRNITINGNGACLNPLVIYGYFSTLDSCQVIGADTGGYSLTFTANGIAGSSCSTSLVENKVLDCRIDGGAGNPFRIADTVAKCTDMIFRDNLVYGGDIRFTSMAGHIVTGNHFYSGDVYFNKPSIGTIIDANYFENEVLIDECLNETVSLNGNTFLARVTCSFGGSGRTIVFGDCHWQQGADLYHNFFATNKRAIVNGGSFEAVTPVVFSSGASTGWVSFNGVWSEVDQSFLTGSRQAAANSIRKLFPVAPSVSGSYGDSSQTLTWLISPTTNVWAGALTTAKTVTLSTTNAINGAKFRIVRSGGGAFALNVGTGPLKALSTGQWCDVEFDGTNWFLSAFGSL